MREGFLFPDVSGFPRAIQGNSQDSAEKVSLRRLTLRSGRRIRTFFTGAIMTSISAASANTYQSPLQKLQDELQSQVSSGAISSTDQDALSSALTDIDSQVQSSRSSDQSNGGKPGDIKSRIDDLISSEVSSGK